MAPYFMVHREVTCSTHPLFPPAPPPNVIPFYCLLLPRDENSFSLLLPLSLCLHLSFSPLKNSFLGVSPFFHLHDTGLSNHGYLLLSILGILRMSTSCTWSCTKGLLSRSSLCCRDPTSLWVPDSSAYIDHCSGGLKLIEIPVCLAKLASLGQNSVFCINTMPSTHLYTSWYFLNKLLVKILCFDLFIPLYLILHADSWYKVGACLESSSSRPKSQLSCFVTPCMPGVIVSSTWENVKPLGWCFIHSSNSVSK